MQGGVVVKFVYAAEVNTFGFAFGKFEPIFFCPLVYFIYIIL